MGIPSYVVLGKSVTFTVNTHDPTDASASDADANPTYRVYEEETAVPILTGTMSKLDDVNTIGFYAETIACTTANGFELGKSYTVYVTTTVGGTEGTVGLSFMVYDPWAATPRTLTQTAAAVAAALSGTTLSIHRGDTWSVSITGLGNLTGYVSLDFTVKETRPLLDSKAIIHIRKNATGVGDGLLRLNGAAVAVAANGSITIDDLVAGDITLFLDEVETAKLVPDTGLLYDIQVIFAGLVDTLSDALLNVTGDITRAIT